MNVPHSGDSSPRRAGSNRHHLSRSDTNRVSLVPSTYSITPGEAGGGGGVGFVGGDEIEVVPDDSPAVPPPPPLPPAHHPIEARIIEV